MVHAMDWFMTGRMCYFEAEGISSSDNSFMNNSELARTNAVRQVVMMPEPGALVDAASHCERLAIARYGWRRGSRQARRASTGTIAWQVLA